MHASTEDVLARPGRLERLRRLARGQWWRHADEWLGVAILVACCAYIFLQLQPHLIFRNTTPNGGDLGAHVWWPAYLRDHLLPWRLFGWSPDFYAGFPVGQFYFPVPALAIVGLDVFVPYNVAFKLVVVLGPVLVPAGAYLLAKGLKAPNPVPAAMAVAMTSFLFFTGDTGTSQAAQNVAFNQRIMGGTLASTLAGEFSFEIAIALGLMFLGALAWALRTRRHLWLPATLFPLCLMSHLMVGIFVAIGGFSVWLFYRPLRNFTRAAAIAVVGVLLSAVWLLPLMARMAYTTNMRYETLGEPTGTCAKSTPGQCYPDYLFPRYFFHPQGWEPYRWGAYILIGVAVVVGIGLLRRSTLTLVVATGLYGLAFRFWSVLGTHVWNLRLLSFWYIGLFLLMAVGVAELIRALGWCAGRGWQWLEARRDVDEVDEVDEGDWCGGPERVGALEGVAVAPWPGGVGRVGVVDRADGAAGADGADPAEPAPFTGLKEPALGPAGRAVALVVTCALTLALAVGSLEHVNDNRGFIPYWAKWNFSGYQNVEDEVDGTYTAPCANAGSVEYSLPTESGETPLCTYAKTVATGKQWPEYRALLNALRKLPPGRSFWEGGPSLDKYGTPLALMLIPYWTKGRITTMEGVYFEASATTPYHFEAVAAVVAPGENSNPVRGIPYRDQQSFDLGIRYLQAMGIDYFIAHDPTTKGKADDDPRLTKIATTPDFDALAPLGWNIYRVGDAPLVEGLSYEPVVATGVAPDPTGWEQQIAVPWWYFADQLDKPVVADGPAAWRHAAGAKALRLPRRALEPVQVSHVRRTDTSISFHVDRTGVPVLVKESYYPNWRASGAQGPYRTTPNFMVVVPTEKNVTLHYARSHAEWAGFLLSLLGLAGLGLLVWWGRRRSATPTPTPAPARGLSDSGSTLGGR